MELKLSGVLCTVFPSSVVFGEDEREPAFPTMFTASSKLEEDLLGVEPPKGIVPPCCFGKVTNLIGTIL